MEDDYEYVITGWVRFLHKRKVISTLNLYWITHLLDSQSLSAHRQAYDFYNRTVEEHPDLWISYKAKRRLTTNQTSGEHHETQ